MNNFQESLEELMCEKNITKFQLSKNAGIHPATLNGYFNHNLYPNIKTAIKLADFFNCSLDYLFGLTESRNYDNVTYTNKPFYDTFLYLIKLNNTKASKVLRNLNMSESDVYFWKNGAFPKTRNLIEIAEYFGCSIDYLVGRSDQL